MRTHNTLAYELLAHLKHLVLAGTNDEGELEWIGDEKQWGKVGEEIKQHES